MNRLCLVLGGLSDGGVSFTTICIDLMVRQNLIRELDLNENNWDIQVGVALSGIPMETKDWGGRELVGNQIAEGRVVRIDEDYVVVDIGYKSEGIVPVSDWDEAEAKPVVGEIIKVLVEQEDEDMPVQEHKGMISLSKKKAAKI